MSLKPNNQSPFRMKGRGRINGVMRSSPSSLSTELKSADWNKILSTFNKAWISTSLYWTVFYSFLGTNTDSYKNTKYL